ncbi:MAG: S9 family peptidase, partial [Chlorobia bacterium]|nr:S9 family peptidase [Fimbriimonadaceae bacterium]
NPNWSAPVLRVATTSFIVPVRVYDIDLASGERTLLREQAVLGDYRPEEYVERRDWAVAPDGARIPISIIHRAGLEFPAPTLLYGYGAYESSEDPRFSIARLSLLDRGMVFAIAHVRGGGELGKPWHDDGKMLKKRNTFSDFAAAADELVYSGWTTRDRLAISGGSAGGLLIGATLNLRPDLCKAAILYVPFVDVINTMVDESLPLTTGEFLEWGNPKKEAEYRYMLSYSPYDNIRATTYPNILVKTSYNDSQVMYWEPAKYVAKMREVGKAPSLIFKTNMAGGHGGSSGRFDVLRERAFDFAWLIQKLS